MSFKPSGYPSMSPYLITERASDVIRFLATAVGGSELQRFERADGSIQHAEVRVDDSVVMMGEATDGWPAEPSHIHIYVPDVDATYASALAAGGESVAAPSQQGDPDRRCGVRDPGGNTWWFSTRVGGP